MFKISLQLDEFATSQIYKNALRADKSFSIVNSWLSGRTSAETPWAGIFEALKASNQETLHLKLAKALARILNSSQDILKVEDEVVLEPESEPAATEAFKLAFFFLCHLVKASSSSSLLARDLCVKALVAADLGILEAADRQPAELLLLTTLLKILAADVGAGGPLPDASLKTVAAATKKTVVDHLGKLLCAQETRVLEALFSLAAQDKQKDSVLKEIASIFLVATHLSSLAGTSITAATLDRAGTNAASSSDSLAFILLTLASSRDPAGTQLRASLMAQPTELSLLLHHSRPAVKKAALDIASMLGFGISSIAVVDDCWSQIALTAVLKFLHDQDANLRVKALTIVENYAKEAPVVISRSSEPEGASESLATSLSDALIDRSILVRRRAVLAFSAIVFATTDRTAASAAAAASTLALISALQTKTMPAVCDILKLPRNSKLYPGQTAATILCSAFISLAQPAQSSAGALNVLSVQNYTPDDFTRSKLQAALAKACLPIESGDASRSSRSPVLEALVNELSTRQVEELRSTLQAEAAANPTLAARLQVMLTTISQRMFLIRNSVTSSSSRESMSRLSKMLFVLGLPQPVSAEADCVLLIKLARCLASLEKLQESLYWCLLSLKLWVEELDAGGKEKLAGEIFSLIKFLGRLDTAEPLKTALSLLYMLPNPRKAFESVLNHFYSNWYVGYAELQLAPDVTKDISFLSTLTVMSELYKRQKDEFANYLKQQQDELRGAQEENVAPTTAAGEDRFITELAQKYLDEVLESQDTAPAAFVPALFTIITDTKAHFSVKVEALMGLQALAVLSLPLAEKCIGLVTSLLTPLPEYTKPTAAVTVQAIKFLTDSIQAFPTAHGSLVSLFGPLLSLAAAGAAETTGASTIRYEEVVAVAAAGSFSTLVLSNKIKVHDCMGVLGIGLASTFSSVTSTNSLALRQLLATSSASGDRAAFILGIAQQTPLKQRCAATELAFQLLPEVDLSSDALVGPIITAALNALQPAAAVGPDGDVGVQVIVQMLKMLSPSIKMLKMLHKGLFDSSTTNLGIAHVPRALRRELEEFVKRAAAPASSDDSENLENIDTIINVEGAYVAGKKRARASTTTAPPQKAVAAVKKVQQEILGLLAVKKGVDPRRRTYLK